MKKDSELKQDVLDELRWDASINEPGIGVAVKDGIVILTGTVDTYAEKVFAEKATKRVKGVRAVVENIETNLLGAHKRTDEEIAKVALNCLRWNTMLPEDSVLVKVERGWLTLEGKVSQNYQKDAAKNAVQNLFGVRGVSNLIEVKSPILPQTVKENIKKTFERNATIDAENINVKVEDHKVFLTGYVQSWDEQKRASEAAWSAPGVWQVENDLEIRPRDLADVLER